MRLATSQRPGTGLRTFLLSSRAFMKVRVETIFAKCEESAPTGGEIEQSLSFRMMRSFRPFL